MAIKKDNIFAAKLKKANSKASSAMEGKKYGQLYVIKYIGDRVCPKGYSQPMVVAQCKCGKINIYVSAHLRRGLSKSCGCLQAELTQFMHTTHGQKSPKIGGRGTTTYSRWRAMIDRCENAVRYLSNGISVCRRWKKFQNFLQDMGECPTGNHTLDRVNNKRGYFKENCRWATRLEQANNTSRNVWVIINGAKYTMSQAHRELGLGKRIIQSLAAYQNNLKYNGLSHSAMMKNISLFK
jgi:cytochrome b involved in lipid metabolism